MLFHLNINLTIPSIELLKKRDAINLLLLHISYLIISFYFLRLHVVAVVLGSRLVTYKNLTITAQTLQNLFSLTDLTLLAVITSLLNCIVHLYRMHKHRLNKYCQHTLVNFTNRVGLVNYNLFLDLNYLRLLQIHWVLSALSFLGIHHHAWRIYNHVLVLESTTNVLRLLNLLILVVSVVVLIVVLLRHTIHWSDRHCLCLNHTIL